MTTITHRILDRTVTMPVRVRDAGAGAAIFEVDATAASALLPGTDFTVVETAPGRAQLTIAVVDYRDNDLGDYDEVGLTLLVRPAGGDEASTGTFILRLPVDQEFTCAAGRRIWGFPKTVEDIDLGYTDDTVTCTLRMDSELVLRLTLPRGDGDELPELPMTSYTYLDGRPHATAFTQSGTGARIGPDGAGVHLELGEHPVAKELQSLGLPAPAVLSTWTEHMRGTFDEPRPLG